MKNGKNFKKLTEAGVLPKDYKQLTETERTAIEALSENEIQAIISTKAKMGKDFFSKHAPHGMLY